MLNRKATNYIFYASLVVIIGLVFLVRSIALGNINSRNEAIHSENIRLQNQIEDLEILIADYRDVQTEDLYSLYNIIPNVFTAEGLTYKTVAILEELGVDESNDMQRTVYVNQDPTFPSESDLAIIDESYHVVQVEVFFTTQDETIVNGFIDALFDSDQLFIIRELDYDAPDGNNFVGVTVHFIAIYDLDDKEESSN
ncbi:MAG: hypothetical protein K9L26_04410 [Candidatus Izimaplasma sp.]|nr:hypothetical protein [Candidatus Izimaplasma bacterium]